MRASGWDGEESLSPPRRPAGNPCSSRSRRRWPGARALSARRRAAVSISTSWTSASRAAPEGSAAPSRGPPFGGGSQQEDGGDPLGGQAVGRPQARPGVRGEGTWRRIRTVTQCRRSSSASSSSSPRMRGDAVVIAIFSPSRRGRSAAEGSPPAGRLVGGGRRAEDDRLAAEGRAADLALHRLRGIGAAERERGRRAAGASLGESCYALFTPTRASPVKPHLCQSQSKSKSKIQNRIPLSCPSCPKSKSCAGAWSPTWWATGSSASR